MQILFCFISAVQAFSVCCLERRRKKKKEKKHSIYAIVMCMSQIADVKMQERARDRERKRERDFVQCRERVTICIT